MPNHDEDSTETTTKPARTLPDLNTPEMRDAYADHAHFERVIGEGWASIMQGSSRDLQRAGDFLRRYAVIRSISEVEFALEELTERVERLEKGGAS